jgi:hypothetical protein
MGPHTIFGDSFGDNPRFLQMVLPAQPRKLLGKIIHADLKTPFDVLKPGIISLKKYLTCAEVY